MTRPYDLPSFTAINCFEAAARNLSFKAAARELNVTPAAVSQQIKALESELAQMLFHRQHRGVDLTEAGAVLFVAVQRGFEGIAGAVHEIRGRTKVEDVVIHATTAISTFWLTPQISAFWRHYPEMVISQVVSDVELTEDRVDLSFRYGPIPEDGGEYIPLFDDMIVAAGSKDFAARFPTASVADLARAPLIYLSTHRQEWTGWKDWLSAFGVEAHIGKRSTVNNFMIALQLAQDGVGAVLCWERQVGTLLEKKVLVPLVPERLPSPHAFYLQVHSRASEEARFLAEWISRQPF
ncbi:LysR family transcriptional regulator [Mameliella sp. CS4]|uniref:LysR substrate-binding domain-containing protein n=1 Tax=Mameliella sp. CS4 TaxID=2862329 RepID=UPI001C605F5C|nr:LysR substrate-binding domain-containing protein [Mameliella sp. CS4]MBW4985927.1 LysR family transcriptional regulator [Mameliella sp. CS4]